MNELTILCPTCVHSCQEDAHFCPHCRSPISSYAATGPFESVFAEGAVWRAAIGTPTKPIVVAGVWMIFLPYAAYGLSAIKNFVETCNSGFGTLEVEDVFILSFGLVFLPVAGYALYRSTKNYWTFVKAHPDVDEANENEGV